MINSPNPQKLPLLLSILPLLIMPIQSKIASTSANIANHLSSPGAINVSNSSLPQAMINISSNSPASPARKPAFTRSQAAYLPPMTANHHTAMQEPGFASCAGTLLSTHSSHASVSATSFPIEFEITQLCHKCTDLQSENNKLKGHLEVLQ